MVYICFKLDHNGRFKYIGVLNSGWKVKLLPVISVLGRVTLTRAYMVKLFSQEVVQDSWWAVGTFIPLRS